ncbi:MAG TPA: hypothetical protein VF820_00635, partial [Patescibacteria group bacterium]
NRSSTSGQIIPSSGIVDTSTKKVITTVSWGAPIASSVSSTDYYHRFVNNSAITQTTQADFNGDVLNGTETTNTSGGEFQIESWSVPTNLASVTSPGNKNATAVVANAHYVFVGTQVQAGGEFYTYDTTTYLQAANPLIFGANIIEMAISGNYVYVIINNNAATLKIVDISNPTAPSIVGSLNLGAVGSSIAVNNGYAFIGSNANLWIVNVTTPSAPVLTGSYGVSSSITGVAVSADGNYAYLSLNRNNNQLMILSTSNKSTPSLVTTYSVTANNSLCIFASGNYVYLGTGNSPGQEFLVINVSNPASPSKSGGFEVGANLNRIFVFNGIAFLASTSTGQQVRILNVNDPTNVTQISTYNLGQNGNDVYFYNSKLFVAVARNVNQLLVFAGGGGGTYFNAGTLESNTLDLGANVALNNITWSVSSPSATTTQFQLAINTDNTTWNYFGPDGTSNTYFALNTLIPLDHINGRYVRYKSFLTGNTSNTPIVSSVSINYSP